MKKNQPAILKYLSNTKTLFRVQQERECRIKKIYSY